MVLLNSSDADSVYIYGLCETEALFALAGAITHSPGLQYRRAGRVGREGLQV